MKLHKTIQNLMLITTLSISSIYADGGKEFNIVPSSPLDPEFFNKDIPASYLSSNEDKNAINYAILESGPSDELDENEIYIEHLYVTSNQNSKTDKSIKESEDIYPAAAGVFIDDDTTVPENLVSIETIPQDKHQNKKIQDNYAKNNDQIGEFVVDESGAVTAKTDSRDKFSAFPKGVFSIGYQMRYLNYSDSNSTCETIYNGINAEYSFTFENNITLKASSSILGGKIFNKNYGSIYSDSKLTLGKVFKTSNNKFSITPYFGFGLRFMNNVFSAEDCIERNTLQLYIPIGLRVDYAPMNNYNFFAKFEVSPIALNQNWSIFRNSYDSTCSSFNGVSALVELGTEFKINKSITTEIKPFYEYIYSDSNSNSPIENSNIHMVGINAYLKF